MSPKSSLEVAARIRRSEESPTSPEPKFGSALTPGQSDLTDKDVLSYFILIVLLIILFCFAMAVVKKLRERNRDSGSEAERVNINARRTSESGNRTAEDISQMPPIHPQINFGEVGPSYAAPKLEDVIPKPEPPMPYRGPLIK